MWPFKKKEIFDLNKPVVNPGLKKAFNIFNSYSREDTLQAVIGEIKSASFLALIEKDGFASSTPKEDGSMIVEKGSKIKFFNIFDEHGHVYLPIFTDWEEIDLWVESRENVAGWVLTINDVFTFTLLGNYAGLVINPCSDKWEMNKDQINSFVKENLN